MKTPRKLGPILCLALFWLLFSVAAAYGYWVEALSTTWNITAGYPVTVEVNLSEPEGDEQAASVPANAPTAEAQ